ncbi:hypothetical protein JCM10213_002840 [Rhodosporidiobolus nylandii]
MADYRAPLPGRRMSRGAADPYGDRPYPPPPYVGGGGGREDYYDDRLPPPPRRSVGLPERDDRRGPRSGRGGYDDRRGGGRGYEDEMRSPEFERGAGRGKRRRSPSPGMGRRERDDYYDRAPPPFDTRDQPPPLRFEMGRKERDSDSGYKPRAPRPDGQPLDPHAPAFDPHFAPPPGRGAPPRRPILEAPHQLNYRVRKEYFADWFAQTSSPSLADSPEALEDAWKKYEADFLRREAKPVFEQFKAVKWFVEKYETRKDEEDGRRERRKRAREGRVKQWVEKAEKGEMDGVSFDFDEAAARRPSIQPNGATLAAMGKTETGDAAGADGERSGSTSENGDAAMKEATTAPSAAAASNEPKASTPELVVVPGRPEQVCIARVPPEVGFKDLEALFAPFDGFVRLSLSDPAPHAAFLRLAWATFTTAEQAKAAMDTIVAAAPAPPAPASAAGEGAETKAKPEDGADAEMAPSAEAKEAEKSKEEEAQKPAPFAISLPQDQSFNLSLPGILSIRDLTIEARIRAAPALTSTPERVKVDLENVAKAIEALELQAEEDGVLVAGDARKGSEVVREKKEEWEKQLEGRKEGMDEEVLKKELETVAKRTLDLSLSYLRSAFDTCYYCCVVCESPETLADMCPKHVRRADDGGNPARRGNEAAWTADFDKRVPLLFPRAQLDVRDYGGEARDEELYRIVTPHVKQEEEGKFRCKECNKLFSARKFVEKHIALKHSDFVGDKLEQLAYYNNYVLDPARVPLAQFQRENYLPSILNPPPPPPRFHHNMDRPLADRIGPKRPRIEPRRNFDDDDAPKGPPPPPPAGQKLDPRASRGASSYADLDGPAGGDDVVALPY